MPGEGRRLRAAGARRRRRSCLIIPSLLASVALLLVLTPPSSALFGMKAKKRNESTVTAVADNANETKNPYLHFHEDDPFPPSYRTRVTEDYGAWEEENGETYVIRAKRSTNGVYSFPNGTIVPKDPTAMDRIVYVVNEKSEGFHCLVPKRKKPARPTWLDIPQTPVVHAILKERAEETLRLLEGKCFYRVDSYWTYEFCYKSHVKQMRINPHSKKVEEERIVGRFNASMPFEVHTSPERLYDVESIEDDGPAWTTSLVTVYDAGEPAFQPFYSWYKAEWKKKKLLGFLPISYWSYVRGSFSRDRPRRAAIRFQCLRTDPAYRAVFEDAAVYLGEEKNPFDLVVNEVDNGVYELTLRSETLCREDLLYLETSAELAASGDLKEEIVCQSEISGKIYKLKDLPIDHEYMRQMKMYHNPLFP